MMKNSPKTSGRLFLALVICAILSVGFALSLRPLAVSAESYPVNSFEDAVDSNIGDGICQTAITGTCTLRAAIQESNFSTTTVDTIHVLSGTYTLVITGTDEDASATGDLDITNSVIISGSGAKTTIIQGGPNWDDRILHIVGAEVSLIARLTISGGNIINGSGAGILLDIAEDEIEAGTLALVECRITHNRSTQFGGGLSSSGYVDINKCTIDNNRTEGDAAARGGGIFNNTNATLLIHNSTVSSNTAQSIGGGIDISNDGEPSRLNNVTIVNNHLLDLDAEEPDGAGISVGNTVVTITNSLIASNTTGSGTGNDCDGGFEAVKFTLIQAKPSECFFAVEVGNTVGLAPEIGPLAYNGGETPTHALLEDSPALNAANPALKDTEIDPDSCLSDDQRGELRTDRCDMGAFELIEEMEIEKSLLFMPSLWGEEEGLK